MKRRIIVEYGNASKIAKAMNCTPVMVSHALNYKKNSFLARKIRHVAKTSSEALKLAMNKEERIMKTLLKNGLGFDSRAYLDMVCPEFQMEL